MQIIDFQPGKFQPVVEILQPFEVDAFVDDHGLTFDPQHEIEAFPNEAIVTLVPVPTTCYDNVDLENGFPVSDTFAGLRCTIGDDVNETLFGDDFFSCPCFLQHTNAAETSYASSGLAALKTHQCSTCASCQLVTNRPRPLTLHVDMPGYDPRPLKQWSSPLRIPTLPGRVILIDKDLELRVPFPSKYARRIATPTPVTPRRPQGLPHHVEWSDPVRIPTLGSNPHHRWRLLPDPPLLALDA